MPSNAATRVLLEAAVKLQREANMIRIRVEYDAYDRKFKLLDREFGSVLDDGAVYQLSVPLTLVELEEPDEFLAIDSSRVAQA